MNKKSVGSKEAAEKLVKNIRRRTFSSAIFYALVGCPAVIGLVLILYESNSMLTCNYASRRKECLCLKILKK